MTIKQRIVLESLPEHFVDDIAETFLFIAKTEPQYLSMKPLNDLLSLCVFFLRRPWAIKSPHLRAKIGQLLLYLFSPASELSHVERWSSNLPLDGPNRNLLENHADAQKYLAPSLLLLYGDVEKTGYYEKINHRRSILSVLKHIWGLASHRGAFRGIATSTFSKPPDNSMEIDTDTLNTSNLSEDSQSSQSSDYFIRFANGILNETNSLVSVTLEKLQEIKKIQTQMQNPQVWGSLAEEARNQANERMQTAEDQVKGAAGLCHETLHMVNLLTSDDVIKSRFMIGEILPRVVGMVLNMMRNLVGSKSLEIKVNNMQEYGFDPKKMLKDVCLTTCNFSEFPEFCKEVVSNGYYESGSGIRKAIATVKKLNLLGQEEQNKLSQLLESVKIFELQTVSLSSLAESAPEEYLDQLMYTIMREPVRLPTSGNIVDRLTISQHLLNDESGS